MSRSGEAMPAAMIPGEVITRPGEIELNAGREQLTIEVANAGDRPIQVGSLDSLEEIDAADTGDKAVDVHELGGCGRDREQREQRGGEKRFHRQDLCTESWMNAADDHHLVAVSGQRSSTYSIAVRSFVVVTKIT